LKAMVVLMDGTALPTAEQGPTGLGGGWKSVVTTRGVAARLVARLGEFGHIELKPRHDGRVEVMVGACLEGGDP
jgi:hypothetical protein